MVESKPFFRNDAMHIFTTKFLAGETNSNTVEIAMKTVGPQRPNQSAFCGLFQAKYWHMFVITTKSSVNVKM